MGDRRGCSEGRGVMMENGEGGEKRREEGKKKEGVGKVSERERESQ